MRRKPSYGIVTAAVTILAILGGIAQYVRRYIPPPPPNPALRDNGAFVDQALRQGIQWHTLSDAVFLEARKLHKPIFLLVGASWSRDGREADRAMFADPEIDTLLSKNFVSVRVDLDEQPEWLNAYFPVSRFHIGLPNGLKGFFLSEDGTLIDYLSPATLTNHDTVAVARDILTSRPSGTQSSSLMQQIRDINGLMASKPAIPDFGAHLGVLTEASDDTYGGFPTNASQELHPEAWRFLLLHGDYPLLRGILSPVLRSTVVDWLDGGFFRRADSLDWSRVEFDKVAVENASMAYVCAVYGATQKDPFATRIANDTFNTLMTSFYSARSGIRTARIGDENQTGRSSRSSLAPADVRSFWNSGVLDERELPFAKTSFGLDPASNPEMVIRIADPRVLADPLATSTLAAIRTIKSSVPQTFTSYIYADVSGYTCARLVECARLWGDRTKLAQTGALRQALEEFHQGDAVRHRLYAGHGSGELTDYLGLSDACLQSFLATGQAEDFEEGLSLLLSAKRQFELPESGAWLMSKGSPSGLPKNFLTPELADNLYESCTAREIRLMASYARLMEGNEARRDIEFKLANDTVAAIAMFAAPASTIGLSSSGYYSASLFSLDPRYAICVGPDAVEVSNELYRRVPTRLVAPAVGSVRPDLQKRPPGIYVISGSSVEGPLTLADAVKRLPLAFTTSSTPTR